MSTDTEAAAAAGPLPWHDEGLARLALAHAYQQAAQWALGSMATHLDASAEPGSFLDDALQLVNLVQDVVRWAVTVERERGTSWSDLDLQMRAADLPPASARHGDQVDQWRQALDQPETVRADGSADDPRIPYPANNPDEGAGRLDAWLLERTTESDPWFRSAQPVGRGLRRHTTLTAMLHAGRYRTHLLAQYLVPPPAAEADAYALQAELAGRLATEDRSTFTEMTAFAEQNRTRAAMLRSLPGNGIRWDDLNRPGTIAEHTLLGAEHNLLKKITPFLADDVYALAPSEIQTFHDLQAAHDAHDDRAAAAIRPGALAIARALTSDDRTIYYLRSDVGEALHTALRAYLAAAEPQPPRRNTG